MAGHSKWANIQHRKGRQDEKRGRIWTRLIREIIVAARQGGGDLNANPRLRLAVDKAKAANMPADNIKRNIDKATGNLEGVQYEEIRYEGYGIGGALLQKGKLYYGASGTSGEIGHITVANNRVPCTCGNYGCLETMASGAALARDAREMVQRGQKTLISRLCEGDPDRIEAKLIFKAAQMGDIAAEELLTQSAEYIGIALGSVINILDPDVIYLCGGLMRNGEKFLRRIREAAFHRQMREAGRRVIIRSGTLFEWNVALGATQVVPYYAWNSHLMDFMR